MEQVGLSIIRLKKKKESTQTFSYVLSNNRHYKARVGVPTNVERVGDEWWVVGIPLHKILVVHLSLSFYEKEMMI